MRTLTHSVEGQVNRLSMNVTCDYYRLNCWLTIQYQWNIDDEKTSRTFYLFSTIEWQKERKKKREIEFLKRAGKTGSPGWMRYMSDSEIERMRFDFSSSNKAHCLYILYKHIGYNLTVQAIYISTTYIILMEFICMLEDRVSMFRWLAKENIHIILLRFYLLFSLLCNALIVNYTVPLGPPWS